MLELQNILVSKDYQRLGIASKLMELVFEETKTLNLKNSIANAVRVRDEYINSEKLLRKFGYNDIYEVKDYWKSVYPNHYCKPCNGRDCICSNVIFLKKFD